MDFGFIWNLKKKRAHAIGAPYFAIVIQCLVSVCEKGWI